MRLTVQHLIVANAQGDLTTQPRPEIQSPGGTFSIACGLDARQLGAEVHTTQAGVSLLHTGTDYLHAVSCKKCKASDAYQKLTEHSPGSQRAEDYLEGPLPAAS